MGFIRKWIQALSVPVDETTGAIRVTGIEGGSGSGVDPVGLKNAADEPINPATKESVDAIPTALGTPAQAGEADAAADLIIAALASIGGSVTANAGTDLNTSLLALEAGGNLEGIYDTLGGAAPYLYDAEADETVAELLLDLKNSGPTGESVQLDAVDLSDSWDAGDPIEIPAGTLYAHVQSELDTFIVCNTSAAAPTVDGCLYIYGVPHKINCKGRTYLHYKGVYTEGGEVIRVTFFLGS